jgi:hypothetical protein
MDDQKDEVRFLAYCIWECAGRTGSSEDHWQQAEAELRAATMAVLPIATAAVALPETQTPKKRSDTDLQPSRVASPPTRINPLVALFLRYGSRVGLAHRHKQSATTLSFPTSALRRAHLRILQKV